MRFYIFKVLELTTFNYWVIELSKSGYIFAAHPVYIYKTLPLLLIVEETFIVDSQYIYICTWTVGHINNVRYTYKYFKKIFISNTVVIFKYSILPVTHWVY